MFYALFVRVPTTPLFIFDESVSMDYNVDYNCSVTDENYNKTVVSFYAPMMCLLDASFIGTQYISYITNKCWGKLNLAVMQSEDIFDLIELHRYALVDLCFGILSNSFLELGIHKGLV